MYDKKTGFKNEYNFVLLFNNKKINELDILSQDLIYSIFYDVDGEDVIKCWLNHYQQKGDILLSINGIIKSISIKMGAKNEVHTEHIHYFVEFLKENRMPSKVIKYYLEYHYADGTLSGKGSTRLSASEYKEHNQYKIDLINQYFSNIDFVNKAVDRFILKGNNCKYRVSGIIYGTPEDYMFVSANKILQLMLDNRNDYSTGVHVGSLFIQPQARDLKFTGKYDKERQLVQVKWFNIFDDIMKEYIKKYQD